MPVCPVCTSLMKYEIFQQLMEKYYRYKIKKPCFLMFQNSRWTLVTMDR